MFPDKSKTIARQYLLKDVLLYAIFLVNLLLVIIIIIIIIILLLLLLRNIWMLRTKGANVARDACLK